MDQQLENRMRAVVECVPNYGNVEKCKGDKLDLSYLFFELTHKGEKPPLEYPDRDKNYVSASTHYDSAGFQFGDESRNK